jgi:hypothetical protein
MSEQSKQAQLPGPGQIFLDHVGWFVPDMDRASAALERLGLALTPFSVQGDRDPATGTLRPVGSANRLVFLERGYLEILTTLDGHDTPVTRHMRSALARHAGVHLVAFTVADAAAEATAVATRGFALQPTVNLRRQIEGEDGGPTEVAFTVIRAAFDLFPEGRVQVLTHHTPAAMWQRRYVNEAGALTGLAGLTLAVADPAECAERFSRFTGRPARALAGGGQRIDLDRGWLAFLPHATAATAFGAGEPLPSPPLMAAVTLTSRDLAETRAHLAARGVTPMPSGADRVVIGPADALGCRLEIVAG